MIQDNSLDDIVRLVEDTEDTVEIMSICDEITEGLQGKSALIAIPVTGVVMARVLVGCTQSKQEALAALSVQLSQVFELITLTYIDMENDRAESPIQ